MRERDGEGHAPLEGRRELRRRRLAVAVSDRLCAELRRQLAHRRRTLAVRGAQVSGAHVTARHISGRPRAGRRADSSGSVRSIIFRRALSEDARDARALSIWFTCMHAEPLRELRHRGVLTNGSEGHLRLELRRHGLRPSSSSRALHARSSSAVQDGEIPRAVNELSRATWRAGARHWRRSPGDAPRAGRDVERAPTKSTIARAPASPSCPPRPRPR